jgi:O-antigen ligase
VPVTSLRTALVGILFYGVATLWVRNRWAICVLEVAVLLCATWLLTRVCLRQTRAACGAVPALLGCMCLWGGGQLAIHSTVVPAETADAVLYWLVATCLAWMGLQACSDREDRQRFLKLALAVGSAVCLLGLVQLFTSRGRVFWLFPSGYDSEVIGPFVSRNNYAAMVELLLPVALLVAFRRSRQANMYLMLAAALVASVIATGSRAGSIIVISEAAVAFLLQIKSGRASIGRRWIGFATLVLTFTFIVGYQYVSDRFRDGGDPFEFRREFVESSVAMLKAAPLHGFGFGTWPAAYRQYALIDAGAPVNHSHNEWIQWSAEGGLPALGLMLAILVLCAPDAVRSIWGLGVLAVFVHSLVDYPFLRLGLAGWVFVFVGALAGYGRERRRQKHGSDGPSRLAGPLARGLALAVIPILILASYQAIRTAWADILYGRATTDGTAGAANLRPDRAEYQLALAQADPDHSIPYLQRAIALNPFLTEARILLASQFELKGDLPGSEAALLELARCDRQYAPAWALANYYFRAGRQENFWSWARTAAQRSPGGMRPLFDLCFALTGDAAIVLERVVVPRRIVQREFLAYLLQRNRLSDAHRAAISIAETASDQDRNTLLDYVDRALESQQFDQAATVWNRLCLKRLVPYPPSAPGTLVNGDFSRPILSRGFDWRAAVPGCATLAQTHTNGPALELFLSGNRPESCEISHQFVRLTAGARYVIRFQYRTMELPDPTGLRWTVGRGQEYEFLSSTQWSDAEWRWQASENGARLALAYRRKAGSTRHEGMVLMRQVRLQLDESPAHSVVTAHRGEE